MHTAPENLGEHGALIDALGGPKVISEWLRDRGASVTPQAISQWRQRGRVVSAQARPMISQMAEDRGVALPPGFLMPRVRTGRAA